MTTEGEESRKKTLAAIWMRYEQSWARVIVSAYRKFKCSDTNPPLLHTEYAKLAGEQKEDTRSRSYLDEVRAELGTRYFCRVQKMKMSGSNLNQL